MIVLLCLTNSNSNYTFCQNVLLNFDREVKLCADSQWSMPPQQGCAIMGETPRVSAVYLDRRENCWRHENFPSMQCFCPINLKKKHGSVAPTSSWIRFLVTGPIQPCIVLMLSLSFEYDIQVGSTVAPFLTCLYRKTRDQSMILKLKHNLSSLIR